MIRSYKWLLLSAFVCLIVSGVCFAQDEDFPNLVQNFDFEGATTAPWTIWVEDPAAAATLSIDENESFTGDQSLLVDISQKGSGLRVEIHQRYFNLKMGDRLTYAFWAKVKEGEAREARMVCNHRADPWTTYGSANINITDEWKEFHTAVNITVDDELVGIYVKLQDTEGLTWLDRFRFYEGDYEEEDLTEIPKIAVEPHSKVASTWAAIKTSH